MHSGVCTARPLHAPLADQMLDVGGVLAFDDIGYPPVQKAILYFLANRNYRHGPH